MSFPAFEMQWNMFSAKRLNYLGGCYKTISSTWLLHSKVEPGWSACPPVFFWLLILKLFVFFPNPSPDGGLLPSWLFFSLIVTLMEDYESKHYPMGDVSPHAVLLHSSASRFLPLSQG